MNRKLSVVIMAAGKGKRMRNPERSKVMYEFRGKPMIQYVMELAGKMEPEIIVPIVGHQKESVMEFLNDQLKESNLRMTFAHQDEQLGTGHALMQTGDILKDIDGDVLILSGDVPMLRFETVSTFLKFHRDNEFDASLISAIFENPAGYGRVLRYENDEFYDIREEKDCNDKERECKEINSGIYIIDIKLLFDALKTLKTDNAQGEYYLTDVFQYLKSNRKKIGALPVKNHVEISGINTVEQLEELEKSL
jgi:UDP-N-acetylglucosamine diphosphorylase/glucosamine-1-phosphate N-acetyltransferase